MVCLKHTLKSLKPTKVFGSTSGVLFDFLGKSAMDKPHPRISTMHRKTENFSRVQQQVSLVWILVMYVVYVVYPSILQPTLFGVTDKNGHDMYTRCHHLRFSSTSSTTNERLQVVLR